MRGRSQDTWIATCVMPGCSWRAEGTQNMVFPAADRHWSETAHGVNRERVLEDIPPIDVDFKVDVEQFRREFEKAMRFGPSGSASSSRTMWLRGQTAVQSGVAALGLALGASVAEVKRAYRAKLREIHPDAGGSGDGKAMVRLQEDYARALREVGAS